MSTSSERERLQCLANYIDAKVISEAGEFHLLDRRGRRVLLARGDADQIEMAIKAIGLSRAETCPPGMRPVKLRGAERRAVNAGNMQPRFVPII